MSLVLVADDEPAVLEVLSEVVEELGHSVLRAHDGREALTLARAQRPCLVVTDHMMPRLSGLELCRKLSQDEHLKSVPVILLSAALPRGAEQLARACLAKPFELSEFEQLVSDVLQTAPRRQAPAQAATSSSDDLARWVSREMKAPLGAAWALLERALQATPEGAPREHLTRIDPQLRALAAQAQALEDISRLAAGRLELTRECCDLQVFLEGELKRWRSENPRIQVDAALAGFDAQVEIDAPRMRLGLEQVLRNVVKHATPPDRVEVALDVSAGLAMLRVRDFGPGIPATRQASIFERFRPGGGGAGLGLFIAFEIARLHGGALSVHSEVGKGSCFTFSLPRVSAPV